MAGKGIYYESQFEEATIEFSAKHIGNIHSVMTSTVNILTRLSKRI